MNAKSLQLCLTLCNPTGLQSSRPLCTWDSPVKNSRVGRRFLLPGIKPESLASPTMADEFFTASTTWEALSLKSTPSF